MNFPSLSLSHPGFIATFGLLVLLCQQSQSTSASYDEVRRLVKQLAAEKYTTREKATDGLIQLGPKTIRHLVNAWENCDSLECKMRILKVLQNVIPKIDMTTDADQLQVLEKLRNSADPILAKLAKSFLGATPEPELANKLQSAINQVLSGDELWVPISDELFNEVKNSSAFQVVRRPPTRNQDRNSHWRRINDKTAHQEILVYRIRWFGGNWSVWMIPGVNDHQKKLNRQHWNCFYDHHHEFIQIMTKIGDRTKRSDFVDIKDEN